MSALGGSLGELLAELHEEAARTDGPAMRKAAAALRQLGGPSVRDHEAVFRLVADACLSVSRDLGHWLYLLVRASRPRVIVEFGTSCGVSTLYLAAAALDNGVGRVLTTESDSSKIRRAREHFARAGVESVVECRFGDALRTLMNDPVDIGFVFLDGAKHQYADVCERTEQRFAPGAIVVADNTAAAERLCGFEKRMRGSGNYFVLPLIEDAIVGVWRGRPAWSDGGVAEAARLA